MNRLEEYELLRNMMVQGEFKSLVDQTYDPMYQNFVVEWWCLKTGNTYEYYGATLEEGLLGVLRQAHDDRDPSTTAGEIASIEGRRKIKVCIPEMPKLAL